MRSLSAVALADALLTLRLVPRGAAHCLKCPAVRPAQHLDHLTDPAAGERERRPAGAIIVKNHWPESKCEESCA
jgi:hypothetical protein